MELGIRIPEDLGTAVSQDTPHALLYTNTRTCTKKGRRKENEDKEREAEPCSCDLSAEENSQE